VTSLPLFNPSFVVTELRAGVLVAWPDRYGKCIEGLTLASAWRATYIPVAVVDSRGRVDIWRLPVAELVPRPPGRSDDALVSFAISERGRRAAGKAVGGSGRKPPGKLNPRGHALSPQMLSGNRPVRSLPGFRGRRRVFRTTGVR
jgi:hypothetical protein